MYEGVFAKQRRRTVLCATAIQQQHGSAYGWKSIVLSVLGKIFDFQIFIFFNTKYCSIVSKFQYLYMIPITYRSIRRQCSLDSSFWFLRYKIWCPTRLLVAEILYTPPRQKTVLYRSGRVVSLFATHIGRSILRADLHRRVHLGRRRPSNEQRELVPRLRHFLAEDEDKKERERLETHHDFTRRLDPELLLGLCPKSSRLKKSKVGDSC